MKVTIDANPELQANPGLPIEYELTPQFPVGYRFRHYATGDVCTVIGYSLTTRVWRDGDGGGLWHSELRYITRHDYADQMVTNRETAASTIVRSAEVQA